MDIELTAAEIQKNKRKKYYIIAGVILVVVIIFTALRVLITPTLDGSRIRYAIAETGDVESTLNGSGVVVPEFEQIIISPFQSKVINFNYRAGETVKAGDSILKLDVDAAENQYKSLLDEYAVKKNKIEKQKLAMNKAINEMITQRDVNLLKLKSLEARVVRSKRLLELGAESKTELDQSELNLAIAQKELQLLDMQIESQKKVLDADLKDLDLEIKIQERIMTDLERKLQDARILASGNGVVTFVKSEIGANVNAGDVVARVANLNSFKIDAVISDMYANKFSKSSPIIVRINSRDYKGTIQSINPSVENGNVKFTVLLDDKKNLELRPNLRVEVFVVISKSQNVIRVKNGPFFGNSASQIVYVVTGNKAKRIDTEFGASNFDYVEIKRGINSGDKVIISDMKDYYHMQEIEIK
jgi:HlyD family secretion protein